MNHPDLTWMLLEASRKAPTMVHPIPDRAATGWSARRAIGRSLIQLGTRLAPTPSGATSEHVPASGQAATLPRASLT